MIKETRKTLINRMNKPVDHLVIEGDDMKELVDYCVNKIRPISKDFYKDSLLSDLSNKNRGYVDVHAGNGLSFDVFLVDKL